MATLTIALSSSDTLALGSIESWKLKKALASPAQFAHHQTVCGRLARSYQQADDFIDNKTTTFIVHLIVWAIMLLTVFIGLRGGDIAITAICAVPFTASSVISLRMTARMVAADMVRYRCRKIVDFELRRRDADKSGRFCP